MGGLFTICRRTTTKESNGHTDIVLRVTEMNESTFPIAATKPYMSTACSSPTNVDTGVVDTTKSLNIKDANEGSSSRRVEEPSVLQGEDIYGFNYKNNVESSSSRGSSCSLVPRSDKRDASSGSGLELHADNLQDYDLPEGAKFIEEGPVRTPMFIQSTPSSISTTPEVKDLPIDGAAKTPSIWMTPIPNTVMIGGYMGDIVFRKLAVWIVNDTYEFKICKLIDGGNDWGVKSGVCLSSETTIIHVEDFPGVGKVYAVRIDILNSFTDSADLTIPTPLGKFEIDDAHQVLRFSKNQVGVLCCNFTLNIAACIEIYKLVDILTEKTIKPTRRIILAHSLGGNDKASVSPDGHICVTSITDSTVFVFNEYGDLLHKLKGGRLSSDLLFPGKFTHPMSAQYGEDGVLTVFDHLGDIHTYDGAKWTLLKCRGGRIYDGVITEHKLWIVDFCSLSVYNIR